MNEIKPIMISLQPTNHQHRCIFDLEGSFNCNEQLVATNQTTSKVDTPTEIQLHTNKMSVEDLYSCSDDTDTTACTSSREDTSTLSGSLSSYLNNWEFNNEHDPLDDSYYSAFSTPSHYHDIGSLVGRSYRDDKTSESLQPLELTHEIQHMLSNESSSSSADNKIDNYFEQPREYIEDQQEDDYSPIDEECRTKMMDWSFRVVSFNFPHNDTATTPTTTPKCKRKRKHSLQALQIVSHAFTLVDRYATHQYRIDGRVMDRQEYKLVCMICLHIAAKTSSLYSLNANDCNMFEKENDKLQEDKSRCFSHDTPDTASDSDESDIAQSQHDFEQRRPPFTILSLSGLLALSSNEYTLSQLISVELNILQALKWKGFLLGTGGTVVDWCLTLLNLLAEDMCSKVFKSIRDSTLINIERYMDKAAILGSGVKPNSLIALALGIHALGAHSGGSCYCDVQKRQLLNAFPYQEEEVFEVLKMHLSY